MDTTAAQKLMLNGIEFDLDTDLLRAPDGSDISLRPQSVAVLRYLVSHAGKVVGKDELLDAVWPGIAVTDNSLTQCISEIRKTLGDEAQVLIRTVSRRGYRLVLPEAEQTMLPEVANGTADDPAMQGALKLPLRGGGVSRLIAAFATLLVAAAVVFFVLRPVVRNDAVFDALSVAVLPFQNLSEAEDQAYLAQGVTDDLTTELARVPGLFVVSRNAAQGFADSALNSYEIAQALGVRYLLEGSVQRAGGNVRVNAQLVDAGSAGQVWAKRFDGTFAELFDLQDQVVAQIVDALEVRLVPGKANLAVSGDTDSPEAFQAMRRGVEARRLNTPEGTVAALSYLRQALALDPEFGAAAAELAWLYWDADEARLAALGIDGTESLARMQEYLDIASRNPSPGYFQLQSDLLVRERRSDEAIALLQQAAALDPSDPWTYEGLSAALSFNGRPGEARGYLDTVLRVDPGWTDWRRYLAALAAFGEGRFADTAATIEEMDLSSLDPWPKFYAMHLLVAAYAHLDQGPEAQRALDSLHAVATFEGDGAPDFLDVQHFFVYKHPADMARLLDGLRKAGMPEFPAQISNAGQKLSGAEIEELVFGRRLVGRLVRPDSAPYRLETSPDGTITKTIDAEVWRGRMWVQSDSLCTSYPRLLTECGPVYRSTEGQEEYRLENRYHGYALSVAP
jgi:TolB-like protein/DNA-binding winged helix-turn-helix (wHTH) protein